MQDRSNEVSCAGELAAASASGMPCVWPRSRIHVRAEPAFEFGRDDAGDAAVGRVLALTA